MRFSLPNAGTQGSRGNSGRSASRPLPSWGRPKPPTLVTLLCPGQNPLYHPLLAPHKLPSPEACMSAHPCSHRNPPGGHLRLA